MSEQALLHGDRGEGAVVPGVDRGGVAAAPAPFPATTIAWIEWVDRDRAVAQERGRALEREELHAVRADVEAREQAVVAQERVLARAHRQVVQAATAVQTANVAVQAAQRTINATENPAPPAHGPCGRWMRQVLDGIKRMSVWQCIVVAFLCQYIVLSAISLSNRDEEAKKPWPMLAAVEMMAAFVMSLCSNFDMSNLCGRHGDEAVAAQVPDTPPQQDERTDID